MTTFQFGDPVTNPHASEDNPQRHGLFVEIVRRRGRMNQGRFARCTDGHGYFWEIPYAELQPREPE